MSEITDQEWARVWRESDAIGTVRWFGPSWHASVNAPRVRIPVPVDERCDVCRKEFVEGSRGLRIPCGSERRFFHYHRGCFSQLILGTHVHGPETS